MLWCLGLGALFDSGYNILRQLEGGFWKNSKVFST